MRTSILLWGLFFLSCQAFGQDGKITLSGRLVDKQSLMPVPDVQLYFPLLNQIASTDTNGKFSIVDLPYGTFSIHILQANEIIDSIQVSLAQPIVELGDIAVSTNFVFFNIAAEQANIPTIAIEADPSSLEDEGIAEQQNISPLLQSSGTRDPFLNAISFVFSQYNFRPRGYQRATQQILINGILMNDVSTGNAVWAQWAGLNDVLRNQTSSYGLSLYQDGIGGLNGATHFQVAAADQAAQSKLAYSLSNRSYTNRIMLSHSSGLNKNGWAFTISASRRWAQEAYVPGTSFDGYSAFVSADKILNSRHQISLSIITAQSARARSGTAIDEVYELAGTNYYNPNWGWQDGEKRNARIAKTFQPISIFQHQYTPSEKTKITSSFMFQTGSNQSSSLDWYNAIDPRPDYYRNLPSYYQNSNPIAATAIKESLEKNQEKLQLDWSRFYNVNAGNIETLHRVNGNGDDSLRANRSLYVIGADVEKVNKFSLATNIQHKFSDKLLFSGGGQFIYQQATYFRKLIDLLGGDYFVNYNMFAAQQFMGLNDFKQNDLIAPDKAIRVGETYRYNYKNTISKGWVWGQFEANLHRFSIHGALSAGHTSYTRNGLYKNGLFATNSFGKSATLNFISSTAKAGITYKINGRNYLVCNAMLRTEDAGINNIFIAPHTRNQTVEKPELQSTQSIELGYLLRAPRLNIRAMGYATDIKNSISIQRFFNDDPEYQSFVNFVMRKVNSRFIGVEFASEYAISSMFTVSAVASVGQSFYTNRPIVEVYNDNDTNTNPGSKEVFIKNYYLGIGPQSAYTVGLTYNSKKYWYCKINGNCFDRNYVAINPARRSVAAAEFIENTSPLFAKIFDQEKLPVAYTIDFSGGKSFRLNKISKKMGYGSMMYFNFGVSNLLNNRQIKSVGFEQLRYDFTNNNPDKFPTKYIYGFGLTFFANLSIKF